MGSRRSWYSLTWALFPLNTPANTHTQRGRTCTHPRINDAHSNFWLKLFLKHTLPAINKTHCCTVYNKEIRSSVCTYGRVKVRWPVHPTYASLWSVCAHLCVFSCIYTFNVWACMFTAQHSEELHLWEYLLPVTSFLDKPSIFGGVCTGVSILCCLTQAA